MSPPSGSRAAIVTIAIRASTSAYSMSTWPSSFVNSAFLPALRLCHRSRLHICFLVPLVWCLSLSLVRERLPTYGRRSRLTCLRSRSRARAGHGRLNRLEDALDVQAECLEHEDRDDRDQCQDQRVLNHRLAFLSLEPRPKSDPNAVCLMHCSLLFRLVAYLASGRRPAVRCKAGRYRRPELLAPRRSPRPLLSLLTPQPRRAGGSHIAPWRASARPTFNTETDKPRTDNRLKVGFGRCFGRALRLRNAPFISAATVERSRSRPGRGTPRGRPAV